MKIYKKKPVEVEVWTFEEFVEYGKANCRRSVMGMPWAFKFQGHQITHENDNCYLMPTLEGFYNFTPNDVLIIGVKGEIYPCKKDVFAMTYEEVSK